MYNYLRITFKTIFHAMSIHFYIYKTQKYKSCTHIRLEAWSKLIIANDIRFIINRTGKACWHILRTIIINYKIIIHKQLFYHFNTLLRRNISNNIINHFLFISNFLFSFLKKHIKSNIINKFLTHYIYNQR